MKKIIFILFMFPCLVLADVSDHLKVLNVRTYTDGMVVQVDAPINSSCGYPDHLQIFISNPNYAASVSLFMTAWVSGKNIRAYYGECGESNTLGGNGNVYVTGWVID